MANLGIIFFSGLASIVPVLLRQLQTEQNFNNLFREAKKAGVDFVIPGILNLRSQTRTNRFLFLQLEFPLLYQKYLQLYKKPFASNEYKNGMYQRLNRIRDYYGLYSSPSVSVREPRKEAQLKLF